MAASWCCERDDVVAGVGQGEVYFHYCNTRLGTKKHPKICISFSTPFSSYFAMLKLLSRQALKALRNPFRSPLPNPLRGPLQTRHLHNALAPPFSGPPSYATISRRFSALSPNPISFFRQKEAEEAIERGQFVDIH